MNHQMMDHEAPKPEPIRCPYCESTNVKFFSLYGQTLLGSQYYCNGCRSIFEVIRFAEEDDTTSASVSKE